VITNRTVTPPRLADLLLALASPDSERPFLLGDFREAFEERAAGNDGLAAARAWYWREALRSVPPLVMRRLRASRVPERRPPREPWSNVINDARYAMRLSRRSPLASLAIVATMTLGIASTTAVFSATNAVLLRPLPFPSSERVVRLSSIVPGGRLVPALAYPDLMDFRRLVPDFSDITVFAQNPLTLQHGPDPQLIQSLQVDDAYARVFMLRPMLGRLFVPADTVLNAASVAVLAYDFWMREFGGDGSIVGGTIRLDNGAVQVVGVLAPDAYIFPRASIDLLTPLSVPQNSFRKNRGAIWASAAGTLKPSASVERAGRDLASVAARLAKEYPNSNHDLGARLEPLREAVVGSVQSMLELLAAAITAVLFIACLNITNLILGRAQARSREFAVRSALGGSPARVRRQMFTESLLLASIGGALGVLLAPTLTRTLIAIYPDALPRADEIGIDASVFLVALAATVAAGVLAAIPTARRVARVDLNEDLRDGGRSGGGRRDRRASWGLVVTQVAASLALLFSAGLLLQTFWRLERVKPGFDPRQTLAFHVYAPGARYRSVPEFERYFGDAVAALREIPGVRVVSTTTLLPFGNGTFYDTFILEERGDLGPDNPGAILSVNTPGLERALGIPVLRGRSFTEQDDSTSEHVVMLNEVAARRFFPRHDAVGHLITWNGQSHWRIIGVVGSTHLGTLSDELAPVLYVPESQAPRRSRYLVMRTDVPLDQAVAAARRALRQIDPTIALSDVATMDDRIQRSLGAQRFRAALMATLGALALTLAIIGIYGVVAYSVSRRTREIGIRMALGEASHDVHRRIVFDALRVAGLGLGMGVVLALLCGKWLTIFLVDVNPYDGLMLAATTGILTAVIVVAAYGPARRAARVDPVAALRAD
jgi:putative ABC transport system permease protein